MGLKGKLLQGRSAGGEIWRRSATELGEVGVGVALRASRSHCQAQSVPVETLRGSGRTEAHRRRGIEVAEVFTGGGPPGGKPALRERSSGRFGLGDSSAALRIFCATRGRLWCGGGVRTRRRGALLRRSCGAGVAGARWRLWGRGWGNGLAGDGLKGQSRGFWLGAAG